MTRTDYFADIDVCVFDVNGVFIDSNAGNSIAMAETFTADPLLRRRIADYYLTLTGIDRGEKIRRIQREIIGRPFDQDEFETRWRTFGRLKQRAMLDAPILEGAIPVLEALGQRGIQRIALSNTPIDELREILDHHGLAARLDLIEGGGDWSKRESLLQLVQRRRLDRDRTLMIGDGKGDLDAARHAGTRFIAIDPGHGEFDGETDLEGPYRSLAAWGRRSGLTDSP